MGLFDFFQKKKTTAASEKLREALFAAIQANDWPHLTELCERHHAKIVREFSGWKTVPQSIRGDAASLQQWCQCLETLANFLARDRGEPELLQQLIGTEVPQPIVHWLRKLQQAEAWMQELRFEDVIPLLANLLHDVRGLQDVQGNVVAANLSKTYGHLGYSYFQTGRADKAVEPLMQALDLCRQHKDEPGTVAYLGDLFEVHRYLGQPEPAADYAERLANELVQQGQEREAAWFHRQAASVRAGEPLVRLIGEVNGQRYELDDRNIPQEVLINYVNYRNRNNLQPALRLTGAERRSSVEATLRIPSPRSWLRLRLILSIPSRGIKWVPACSTPAPTENPS